MSNINFCHFTSIREIWNWKNNIIIPDIQRGLVWNAAQIEVFWDSILRGIPIGFFTISKINNENILLDGQQRWNAIISAKDTKNGTLWCCIPSKNSNIYIYNRKYLFRWTTDDHPWGWHFDADEKSYAITTSDFQNFECSKRKATLSVVMRGVSWNEEYSTVNNQQDAISFINKKWENDKKNE